MKNITKLFQTFLTLLLLCSSLWVNACSDDKEKTVDPEVVIPERVLADGMSFSKTGGKQTLNVRSNVTLEVISSAPEWCKVVEESSTSKTVFKYTIEVEANTTHNNREAAVTVKAAGRESGKFTVSQTAADGLIIASESLSFSLPASGGNISVKLTANGNVVATPEVTWIKDITTRSMTERTYTFSVSENLLTERVGNISFTLGEVTETVVVTQAGAEAGNMNSNARELAAKMYAGINIGNTLEACDNVNKKAGETMWGNPVVNETYIKGLKTAGFNAVRIPCAWDYYIVDQATHKIDDAWLNRVSEVVGYCVANDMYAIVNIHWDGGWLEESVVEGYKAEVDAKQKALWTQIANKLKDYDEHLLFAGCNEPGQQAQDKMSASAINALIAYEQTFIDAVRATGGNNATRCLIVQGPYTNIDRTVKEYAMPVDKVADRLMVEVHFYDPYPFTLMEQDADWGKIFWYWGADNHVSGSPRNATWGEEAHVKQQFALMKTAYVDKGIPVILGEYAAMKRTVTSNQEAHDKSRGYWNEVVTREAKKHGIVPFHWETGGAINRFTGAVTDSYAINGIMKGASEGKYPY